MLRLAPVRIFAAVQPITANAGVDRLAGIVREVFGEDPFSGALFCFFNARRTRVKLLVWDRNGFWLLSKRLERGCFEKIDLDEPRVELDRVQLAMLLEGLDTRKLEFRKHFAREIRLSPRADEGSRSARVAE
jgi:transposase